MMNQDPLLISNLLYQRIIGDFNIQPKIVVCRMISEVHIKDSLIFSSLLFNKKSTRVVFFSIPKLMMPKLAHVFRIDEIVGQEGFHKNHFKEVISIFSNSFNQFTHVLGTEMGWSQNENIISSILNEKEWVLTHANIQPFRIELDKLKFKIYCFCKEVV